MMKGIMMLDLLLPGAVLWEQLITTAAGRVSITARELADKAEESSVVCCPPQYVYKSNEF